MQTRADDNWVTGQRNRFIGLTGKAVTAGKFKAAVSNVSVLIDYVNMNASVSDTYIFIR